LAQPLERVLGRFIWLTAGAKVARRGAAMAASVSMLLEENVVMRTYDFTPLFRSTVGFDRLFDLLDNNPA
jgi:hypothetical protein